MSMTISMTGLRASGRAGRRAAWRATGAALVLALAGAAIPVAQAMPAGPGWGMHGPMAGAGAELHRLERMLDSAGAGAEQKARVREIMRAALADLRAQRDGGRELRQQMLQLLTAPQLDAAAVEALRQQLSAQREAGSKRLTQALLDASAVLTPEQRVKLGQRMKQRHELMLRHQQERRALDAQPAS